MEGESVKTEGRKKRTGEKRAQKLYGELRFGCLFYPKPREGGNRWVHEFAGWGVHQRAYFS